MNKYEWSDWLSILGNLFYLAIWFVLLSLFAKDVPVERSHGES